MRIKLFFLGIFLLVIYNDVFSYTKVIKSDNSIIIDYRNTDISYDIPYFDIDPNTKDSLLIFTFAFTNKYINIKLIDIEYKKPQKLIKIINKFLKRYKGKYLYKIIIKNFNNTKKFRVLIYANISDINQKYYSPTNYLAKKASSNTNFILTSQDLKDTNIIVDYLIITPPNFISQAIRLASYRDTFPKDEVLYPKILVTDTIYKLFLSNNKDKTLPKAYSIREAILTIHKNSHNLLKYAVLLGSGYDERKEQPRKNYIPAFIISYSGFDFLSDDFFGSASIDSGDYYSIYPLEVIVGRLPGRDSLGVDIDNAIDKIIKYEGTNFGLWKNTILIAVDDDYNGDRYDPIRHEDYVIKYIQPYIPSYVQQKWLSLQLYEKDENGFKPGATQEFVNQINEGRFFVIYSGHGAFDILADEKLFHNNDIILLHNQFYPIMLILSCSVGKFTYEEPSMAEVFLNYPNYGSNIFISATELTLPYLNSIIGGRIVENLYSHKYKTIGEVLTKSKENISIQINASVYNIFGDPATIISLPSVKKVNIFSDYKPLEFYNIYFNSPINSYILNYEIRIFDGLRKVSYYKSSSPTYKYLVTYYETGNIIYREEGVTSTNTIQTSFIMPKNIKIGDSTALSFIYLYDNQKDYIFYRDSIKILYPSVNSFYYKGEGPDIEFFILDKKNKALAKIHNYEVIKLPSNLYISIYDSSGIYLNPSYIQTGGYGGLPVYLDNQILLYGYEKFIYTNNDKTEGNFEVFINSLSQGLHKLKVFASNLKGETSVDSLIFYTIDSTSNKILYNTFSYPNPSKHLPIKVFFSLTEIPDHVDIYLYNSKGKKIFDKKLYKNSLKLGQNSLEIKNSDLSINKILGKGIYILYLKAVKADRVDKNRFKIIIE